MVDLIDGSRLNGTPNLDTLKVSTEYAEMQIPLAMVHRLELSGTDNTGQVDFLNGDHVNGTLGITSLGLKTIFGSVDIPVLQLRDIQVLGTGGGKPLPDGLVLHYSFDANTGDRIIDTSGSGSDGRVQGATYTSEGKIDGAMSFNGERAAVVVGNPRSLQLQDFTIAAWIKRGDVEKPSGNQGDDAEIFGYGHGGYMLGMAGDGRLFFSKVDIDNIVSQFQIRDGQFHHVAVTKNGNEVVFYLDGVGYPPQQYDPGFEFTTDAALGTRADMMVHCFLGVIDELAVFNRALSPDEIKGIYDSQK